MYALAQLHDLHLRLPFFELHASLRRLCETYHFLTLSVSEHLCRRSVCVPQGCHGCKEPQILRAALKALNNRPPVGTAASRCKRHTELYSVH